MFDFGAIVSQQCRLFEGELGRLGTIVPSSMTGSIIGTIQLTPSLFTQHGLSCSLFCDEARYLTCSSNLICECLPHTYWDASIGMCLAQWPILGAPCEQNINMCREDLSYTCLQFNQCGPLSLLSGTTIANRNTIIEDGSNINISYPTGIMLYDADGESLVVVDTIYQQVIHLWNISSNNTNVSVLIPPVWPNGDSFDVPYGLFVDVKNDYNLYVSDSANNRIVLFHAMQTIPPPLTVVPTQGGGSGSALTQLTGPYGVTRDSQGNTIITDMYNHRVMRWAPNATSGVVIIGTGAPGNSSMELSNPQGLFLDEFNSLLYVADLHNNRVQLFNLSGPIPYNGITVAGGFGPGTGNHQLTQPSAIWVSNKTGTIYI